MTQRSLLSRGVLFVIAGLAASADAAAADSATGQWNFTTAAYVWLAASDGTLAAFGAPPADASASVGDLLDNLEAGLMGLGEARRGRLSLAGEVFWIRLSEERGSVPGVPASSVEVTTESSMLTGLAGYSLVGGGTASLDAIGGARVWTVDHHLQFGDGPLAGTAARDNATWVDPVVGVKWMADFGSRYYATGWALVGGSGAGSDSMWDVMGAVGYDFNDEVSVAAGYRILGVDYRDGGFAYDIEQSGVMLGAVVEF